MSLSDANAILRPFGDHVGALFLSLEASLEMLVPSEFMTYISESVSKTILRPSGDHSGLLRSEYPSRILLRAVPSVSMTNMSLLSSVLEVNTTLLPFGDHAAAEPVVKSLVSRTTGKVSCSGVVVATRSEPWKSMPASLNSFEPEVTSSGGSSLGEGGLTSICQSPPK